MIGRLQVCKKFVITLFYFISDYRCQLMTGWFSPFLFYLSRCTEPDPGRTQKTPYPLCVPIDDQKHHQGRG